MDSVRTGFMTSESDIFVITICNKWRTVSVYGPLYRIFVLQSFNFILVLEHPPYIFQCDDSRKVMHRILGGKEDMYVMTLSDLVLPNKLD